jgi:hypothetical protein
VASFWLLEGDAAAVIILDRGNKATIGFRSPPSEEFSFPTDGPALDYVVTVNGQFK